MNIKQRALELLQDESLRGRVPSEVQEFLRDAASAVPYRWLVGDEAFHSEAEAIEAIRQWGPSDAIATPVYAHAPPAVPVTESNCAERIALMLMDCADTLGMFPCAVIDSRAWEHLLVYAPKPAVPVESLDASIIKEASDVLEAVGVSGVSLPANWRWPLADELRGIAAAMKAPPPASVPDGWRDVMRAVLERDGGRACHCISHSRDAEREYERGQCPHQRAAAMLATTPEPRT